MDVFELNDGNKLPAVALGTSRIKPDEMNDVIMSAIDIGYRHFDSAQLYQNAAVFGNALSKALSSRNIKREDVFVTSVTKMLAFFHNRPEDVRPSMKECLEKLGLEYVDLFLIHHPAGLKKEVIPHIYSANLDASGYIPYHEEADHISIWREMEKLVEDKLTRSIGVSNLHKDQLSRILQNSSIKIKPAVLQIECHISLQEKETVKFCHENNIVVTAYAALGSPNLNMNGYVVFKMIFDFELSKTYCDELSTLDRGERIFNYPFQIYHPQNPYPPTTV